MKINEYLDSKNIPHLDDETLAVIEEFIGGTQIAIATKSIEMTAEQYAWQRENTLTKREQLAGFAIISLSDSLQKYTNLENIVIDAYAIADAMIGTEVIKQSQRGTR